MTAFRVSASSADRLPLQQFKRTIIGRLGACCGNTRPARRRVPAKSNGDVPTRPRIQAAKANEKREPEGRRNEYIAIDIALMRELRGTVWAVSVLDVDENAEGPPAWLTNPSQISSWCEAISSRRALLQAIREMPEDWQLPFETE